MVGPKRHKTDVNELVGQKAQAGRVDQQKSLEKTATSQQEAGDNLDLTQLSAEDQKLFAAQQQAKERDLGPGAPTLNPKDPKKIAKQNVILYYLLSKLLLQIKGQRLQLRALRKQDFAIWQFLLAKHKNEKAKQQSSPEYVNSLKHASGCQYAKEVLDKAESLFDSFQKLSSCLARMEALRPVMSPESSVDIIERIMNDDEIPNEQKVDKIIEELNAELENNCTDENILEQGKGIIESLREPLAQYVVDNQNVNLSQPQKEALRHLFEQKDPDKTNEERMEKFIETMVEVAEEEELTITDDLSDDLESAPNDELAADKDKVADTTPSPLPTPKPGGAVKDEVVELEKDNKVGSSNVDADMERGNHTHITRQDQTFDTTKGRNYENPVDQSQKQNKSVDAMKTFKKLQQAPTKKAEENPDIKKESTVSPLNTTPSPFKR